MINITMSLSELIVTILIAAIVAVVFYYVFQDKIRRKKEEKLKIQPKIMLDEIMPNLDIIKAPGSPTVKCRPTISIKIENIGLGRAMNVKIDGYAVFGIDAPDKFIASCFYFSNSPQNGAYSINNMSIQGDSGPQTINLYTHGYAVSDEAIEEGIRLRISYTDIYNNGNYIDTYDKDSCIKAAPGLAISCKKTLDREIKCLIWPDSEPIYLDSRPNRHTRNGS